MASWHTTAAKLPAHNARASLKEMPRPHNQRIDLQLPAHNARASLKVAMTLLRVTTPPELPAHNARASLKWFERSGGSGRMRGNFPRIMRGPH